MSINVNTIKGQNINCIILKAYVYAKDFVRTDGKLCMKYLTVISEVPEKEFSPRISMTEGKKSPTFGVFVEVIGDGEIMRPSGRVGLSRYQEYIESQGYTFIGTAPGVKGATWEETRIAAYQVIKKHKKGGDKKKEISALDKAKIFKYLDNLERTHNEGQCIVPHMEAIRSLIANL